MNTKFKKFIIENLEERPELIQSIREYLLTNYPSEWWNNQFIDLVEEYISEDDLVGDGDEDDPETWTYEDKDVAYRNLSTGGAIEYDLIEEIRKNIIDNFNIKDDEYFKLGIDNVVEDHMCNMIDWYDHFVFGKDKRDASDIFGFKKSYKDLTSHWDDKY